MLQSTLRDRLLGDPAASAAFLGGLRSYLDDPLKVRRLLLPTVALRCPTPQTQAQPQQQLGIPAPGISTSGSTSGAGHAAKWAAGQQQGQAPAAEAAPSLMNLMMALKPLQHSLVDVLLDAMLEACSQAKREELGLTPPKHYKAPGAPAVPLHPSASCTSLCFRVAADCCAIRLLQAA